MVESGGLENRCTFTGTVGSNPTLSARPMERDTGQSRCRAPLFSERSPNWYGTALEARRAFGLCGFESRPLRQIKMRWESTFPPCSGQAVLA